MGVAAQVAQYLHRTAKGWLGIDDPVLAIQATKELREWLGLSQSGGWASAAEFLVSVQAFETGQKFSVKDATEDFHR